MLAGKRLLGILGVIALQIMTAASAVAQNYSNRDYCLSSGHIRLFMVDITTKYDQTDKEDIVGMIDKVLSESKGGDSIVVRTITDSQTSSERLIERCIPQCPAEGFINRLFKCSDGLIRTDTIVVRRDILNALRNRLESFHELKYSDIIRTINSAAREESKGRKTPDLYAYSDLLENSDGLIPEKNFFQYPIGFLLNALKKFDLIAPLPNAQVQVAGVGRADTPDRRPLNVSELNFVLGFWKAYFTASGAATVSISQRASGG